MTVPRQLLHASRSADAIDLRPDRRDGVSAPKCRPTVIGTNSSSADGGLPSTFGVQAAVVGEVLFGSRAPNPVSMPRSWQSAGVVELACRSRLEPLSFVTVMSVS